MTTATNKEELLIVKEQDVVPLRNRVKEYGVKIGMSILNQTKLITATSELVRNLLKYGGGGKVIIESVTNGRDLGVRVTFIDKGTWHKRYNSGHAGRLQHRKKFRPWPAGYKKAGK
ncbi:hypothetical protein [Flavobacterium sp. MMS24-S5]|uniref:hypothetical protein n=1 Tax=Flavobacterium sp. MMS24-S5 TaxID=3416605 RepID=UPI003D042DCC